MYAVKNILISMCFLTLASACFGQSTASQDIKVAGDSAKTAAAKTSTAAGKGTLKGVKAMGRGLKWTGKKVALGTGAGIEKSGAALKSAGK